MTNREFILKITDKDHKKRLKKITSFIERDFDFQHMEDPYTDIVNVIIPALDQENKISIIAHHDVVEGSAGYNDNSSGVVTLLKLQNEVPPNVELVFTDGEEFGGRGCNLYLNESVKPKIAINVDVVGLGDTIFYEKYGDDPLKVDGGSMEYYKYVPFSDSYILQRHGVTNILLLTGINKESLIRNIWECQHNGRNDGVIDLIQEPIMDKVYHKILQIVRMNHS